jgi:hypothetical protein
MAFFDSIHGPELIQTHAIPKTPAILTAMGAEYITQLTHA